MATLFLLGARGQLPRSLPPSLPEAQLPRPLGVILTHLCEGAGPGHREDRATSPGVDTGTDGRGAPHSWHDLWNLWVIFSGFSSLDLPPLARVCAALWWKPTCRTVPSPRWCADRVGGQAGVSHCQRGAHTWLRTKSEGLFFPEKTFSPAPSDGCKFRALVHSLRPLLKQPISSGPRRNDMRVCLPRGREPVMYIRDRHSVARMDVSRLLLCITRGAGETGQHRYRCGQQARATGHNATAGGTGLGRRGDTGRAHGAAWVCQEVRSGLSQAKGPESTEAQITAPAFGSCSLTGAGLCPQVWG